MDRGIFLRIAGDITFKLFVIVISFLSTIPLLLILFYIFKNGIASVNWGFFVNLPKPVGELGGGISNALIGTAILTIISSLFSIY